MKRTLIILLTLITALITPPAFAVNRVLSLDGDGDYVEVPDADSLDLSDNFTFEAWVFPTATSGGNMIFNKEDTYEWAIINGNLQWALQTSVTWYWLDTGISVPVNQWTHLALTYDSKNVSAYVNGLLLSTLVHPQGGKLDVNDSVLRIGGRSRAPSFFAGQLDEVRIWSTIRTQEDIQMTMHTTLSGKEVGLVGYWRFDDDKKIANDLSPNVNDGKLSGDAKLVESDLHLAPATANFIHVPKDYTTIQAAIDAAGKDDVVVVSPGTYHETIRLKSGVMVRGMDAVIRGNNDAIIEAVNVTNASLIGFTIDGMDVAKNGILCKGNSDVNISYNVILFAENAIGCFGSSRPKIRNNTFGFNKIGVRLSDSAQSTIGGSKGASNDFFGNAVAIRNETANRINASYNYLGATDENRIAELIKNTGGGSVDFTSFLANVTRTSSKFSTNASALSSAAMMFSRLNQTDRALACSERAVELAERAVESDSFSIEYRRALGKIYLEFANTFATVVSGVEPSVGVGVQPPHILPQKALEQFEWVLFSEPLDQESWNGVYQIALSNIDKKEFSAFASRLRKVFWEGTPQRKFLDGAEALRNADEDVRLKAIKTVQNSARLVLGPFEIPDRRLELFNFIQSGGDAKLLQPDAESSIIRVDPNATYPADGKQLKWTKSPLIPLFQRGKREEQDANANLEGTAYSSTFIISPDERQVLLVCQGNAIKVWLNSQVISERTFPTDMTIPVTLRKGRNRIVVKTTGKTENWNLTLGIADAMGKPIRDITFASAYERRGTKDRLRSISVNHALSLNGDYVEIADSEELNNIKHQVTMEAWIKATAFPTQWMPIIYKGDERTPNFSHRSYCLWLRNDGVLHLTSAPSGTGQVTLNSPSVSIALNTWYHVAGVIDAKNGVMKILLNGTEVARRNFGQDIHISTLPLRIGGSHEEEVQVQSNFAGQIDEVRIFNYARTPEEIQATLNTTLTGDETGLVGYWNFDDGAADDLSPNRNDGNLYGDATIVESDLKRLSLQMAIDTVDGFNTVPVNQKGQFVLTTRIGAHEVVKPIKTIEIQPSKAFRPSETKMIGDVLFDAQPFKSSSTQAGSVLRIQLEEGIMEGGLLKVSFEVSAGSTTASNLVCPVRLLAADGTVIREVLLGSIAIISDTPLPAPNGVVANPVAGENDGTISWTPSDDERVQFYEVFANEEKIGNVEAGLEPAPTYIHLNAEPGATIAYTVIAVAASTLKSEPSQPVSVTVGQDTTSPESPRYVQVKRVGSKGVELTWESPAPDALTYHVLRGTSEKDLVKIAEVKAAKTKFSQEYLDTTPRAYLYAIDVVDDQGNTAPKPLRIFPVKPKAGEIESVSIVMGEKNEIDGIRMPNAGDGQHEAMNIEGKPCRRNLPNGRYLYFDLDDRFDSQPLHEMYVTLEVFDESAGNLYVDGGVSQSLREPLSGSERWRTVTFHLPNARFANQQPYHSDFRLVSEGRLAVASLMVSKAPPKQALREMQWALIGSFDIASNDISDFETSQPPENAIDLNATYPANPPLYEREEREIGWFETPKYTEYKNLAEFVDLKEMLSWSGWGVGYALTYLESTKDELVQ